ncbi:translational GTPase TypA [Candidatus Woesebacteria bacterium]|nr:translational GTPase TypA [Candidatus Woesebacteria bacterium]
MDIRNIAVIAHVDHGKTTLVDALLKQTHVFRQNEEEMGQSQILDRNELERERGITILAKNCSVHYKDTKINIIDTPGHADFSGEVERTLGMADGALLIVDAQEGPMPQTRFVLKKALELGLKIIVVINKIDKKMARAKDALSKVESLFLELAREDSNLDFKTLYAIGRRGVVFENMPSDPEKEGNVTPLLEAIINLPETTHKEGPFKMVVTSIDYDPHLGKIVIGKIHQGEIKKGMKVILTKKPNKIYTVEELFAFEGLKRQKIDFASAGEIVCFSGIDKVEIGETVSDPADTTELASAFISEPTLHMTLGPNTSPFAGLEGEFTTSRQIEERLNRELESNLSLRVKKLEGGKFAVSGKGELHLSILLETMRREGYEMEVGKPEVITKTAESGELVEPIEEVSIIVPNNFVGVITEEMGKRYARLINMTPNDQGETEFIYQVPTRALIGMRGILLTATKGTAVYNSAILGYEEVGRTIPVMRRGVLVADRAGEALAYGLQNAQGRGITFIDPGTRVYEGMIIGLNAKDEDVLINVSKGKKLTNMRSKSSDGVIQLTPATKFSLEQSLDFLEADELLEITPHSLRLRKKHLSALARKRHTLKDRQFI